MSFGPVSKILFPTPSVDRRLISLSQLQTCIEKIKKLICQIFSSITLFFFTYFFQPLFGWKFSNAQIQILSAISADKSKEVYPDFGKEALDFARKALTDKPEYIGKPHPDKLSVLHSPLNPGIGALTHLFWKDSFIKFTALLQKQGKDAWKNEDLLKAADECMKIAYSISNLALDELEAVKQLQHPKGGISNAKFLANLESYHSDIFYFNLYIYHWMRGAAEWRENSSSEDRKILYFSDDPPFQEHITPFYRDGSRQSNWRALYNHYCERLKRSYDERELNKLDSRYYRIVNPDLSPELFMRTDAALYENHFYSRPL
jgi:hypothetical protein